MSVNYAGAGTGALTGAAAGATLGTAFPVIGTAVGAVGGALIGGVAGGMSGGGGKSKKKGGVEFNPPGYANPFGSYAYNKSANQFQSTLSPEEQTGYETSQAGMQAVRENLPTDLTQWNDYTNNWVDTYLRQLSAESVPQLNAQMYSKGVTPGSSGYGKGMSNLMSQNASAALLGGYNLANNQYQNLLQAGQLYGNDINNIYSRMQGVAGVGLQGAGLQQQNAYQNANLAYANQQAQNAQNTALMNDIANIGGNYMLMNSPQNKAITDYYNAATKQLTTSQTPQLNTSSALGLPNYDQKSIYGQGYYNGMVPSIYN